MSFRELQVELRQIERERRITATLHPKIDTKTPSPQSPPKAQSQPQYAPWLPALNTQPKQQRTEAASKPQKTATNNKPTERQQTTNEDIIQELINKVQHLTQTVEYLTSRPQHKQMNHQQPNHQRVFICHRCGQEGHIARGCRNIPLNFQGPRSEGKPEARSQAR